MLCEILLTVPRSRITPANNLSHFLQVSQLEVPVLPANPIGVPLYDMDRRSWELEPDMG